MAQLRDSKGRFTSSNGIKAETSSSSPDFINPEFEKPLLQVSITNPLRKIMYWLDQIRRKQTTTFMIKLSIPLIALPVLALAFFQLGRTFPGFPTFLAPTTITPTLTPAPTPVEVEVSRAGILKVARGQQTRYLLSLKDGGFILIELPSTINLDKYQNKQVLVTGMYSKKTNILKVEDIAAIETLEAIPLTSATPSPSPTLPPSPTASPSATPTP